MRTLKGVKFKVARTYAYEGDFIITQGILYYFPQTDLIQQRIDTVTDTIAHGLTGVMTTIVSAMIGNSAQSNSDQDDDLMGIRDTDVALQKKLDYQIKAMKENRSGVTSSSDLPLPLRYEINDIKNLGITFMGELVFDAQFDTHEYKFGINRKKDLRDALIEGGFLS